MTEQEIFERNKARKNEVRKQFDTGELVIVNHIISCSCGETFTSSDGVFTFPAEHTGHSVGLDLAFKSDTDAE